MVGLKPQDHHSVPRGGRNCDKKHRTRETWHGLAVIRTYSWAKWRPLLAQPQVSDQVPEFFVQRRRQGADHSSSHSHCFLHSSPHPCMVRFIPISRMARLCLAALKERLSLPPWSSRSNTNIASRFYIQKTKNAMTALPTCTVFLTA